MQFQKTISRIKMRKLWTRNRKFQSTFSFYTDLQIEFMKVYLTFMMICDILHEHSAEYLVCWNVVSGCSSELLSMQCAPCAAPRAPDMLDCFQHEEQ